MLSSKCPSTCCYTATYKEWLTYKRQPSWCCFEACLQPLQGQRSKPDVKVASPCDQMPGIEFQNLLRCRWKLGWILNCLDFGNRLPCLRLSRSGSCRHLFYASPYHSLPPRQKKLKRTNRIIVVGQQHERPPQCRSPIQSWQVSAVDDENAKISFAIRLRPSLLGWRPSLLGWRPSLLGWRPSLLGCRPSLLGCRPSLLGWRPSLLGWRPSLLGWRPSLLGWRPSLLGWRPLHLNSFCYNAIMRCQAEKNAVASSFALISRLVSVSKHLNRPDTTRLPSDSFLNPSVLLRCGGSSCCFLTWFLPLWLSRVYH